MLANVGFLIMAATILLKQRRQKRKLAAKDVRSWLRSVASLTVVMGVTWVIGVLVLEVDALLPLAYIYTIVVAFQGVGIFLFLVVFEQKAIELFTKKLKKSKTSAVSSWS